MSNQGGSVSGKVCDATGEALPGATITLSGPQFDEVQVSRADGQFIFHLVPPGSYSAKAQMEGFSSQIHKPVDVRLGRDTVVDYRLQVQRA